MSRGENGERGGETTFLIDPDLEETEGERGETGNLTSFNIFGLFFFLIIIKAIIRPNEIYHLLKRTQRAITFTNNFLLLSITILNFKIF